jgi:hypothetical protein
MCEYGFAEVHADLVNRLTLGLIDGHRECELDWKLTPVQFDCEVETCQGG